MSNYTVGYFVGSPLHVVHQPPARESPELRDA
jgi:hypothetical protein